MNRRIMPPSGRSTRSQPTGLQDEPSIHVPGRRYVDKLVRVQSRSHDPSWILLEPNFKQTMIEIEQEYKVAFVTSIERLGEQRRLHKGLRDGEAALLRRLLTRKFGTLPTQIE